MYIVYIFIQQNKCIQAYIDIEYRYIFGTHTYAEDELYIVKITYKFSISIKPISTGEATQAKILFT